MAAPNYSSLSAFTQGMNTKSPNFKVGNMDFGPVKSPWEQMDGLEQANSLTNPAFGDLNFYGNSPYASQLQSFISGIPGSNYKAKDMSKTALPAYDAMRSRLNSQYNTTQQQGQDAIDRQFAAMGGGPSGAQVKQTENLVGSIAKQRGEDMDSINAHEAEARTGLQQQESQKEFQSGEAGRGYQFQGIGTLGNLDLQYKNAQKEAMNDQFNKIMAQYQSRHSGGLLGGGGFLGTGIGA